jgi:glycine/D-amino acid oxidase-like deaminating enzyme
MKVVVMGAGIVGMSVSWHLAKRGVSVVAIERDRPGGCASASTFACINFFNYWQPPYFELRRNAIDYARDLAANIGAADFYHLPGTLRWAEDAAGWDAIERSVAKLKALNVEVERWSPGAVKRELEPDLDVSGIERDFIRVPGEGWMDGTAFTGRLLAAAEATGRFEWLRDTVRSCEASNSGVTVRTTHDTIHADALVLAAGINTPELAKTLGVDIPIKADPGVLAISDYLTANIRHTLYAGPVHVRPDGAGRVMAGRHGGDFPPDCTPEMEARLIVEQVARRLPALALAPAHTVRVGVRPVPRDGHPIVGWLPGHTKAYVVGCHSGMTLGPYLGQLAARELLGDPEERLAPYRLERFK